MTHDEPGDNGKPDGEPEDDGGADELMLFSTVGY